MIVKINKVYVFKNNTGEIVTTELGYFAAEEMEAILPIVWDLVAVMDTDGLARFTYRNITKKFHIGNAKLNAILDFLTEEGFLKRFT